MAQPMIRLSVLYPDESLNYFIPSEDIVLDGVAYNENYTNGQRRNLSLKLINVADKNTKYIYLHNTNSTWINNYYYEKNNFGYQCITSKPHDWDVKYNLYYIKSNQSVNQYKYFPDVNGLWYGTKIKYE